MKRRILILLLLGCPFLLNGSCTKPENDSPENTSPEEQTPEQDPETPGPEIVLVSPADGFTVDLWYNLDYVFEWNPMEGQNFYRLYFSRSADMAEKTSIVVDGSKASVSWRDFAAALKEIGFTSAETADVWWSVGPWTEGVKYTPQVRRMKVTTLKEDGVSEPVTDPVKVKVAVVYEDPVFQDPAHPSDPRNGKRIHEIEHWNDPWAQMAEYAAAFEEVSHGAVDIEIVEEHDSQQMFCYTASTANSTREYMTPPLLYQRYLDPDPETGKAHIDIDGKTLEYDYVAMMDAFGLSAKVDDGTINEVWVYNHPACKMNESRFMGKGGFWCNSMPIEFGVGKNYAHNKKLVCVMFCNYERTVDLALHSFAHRTESIMSQVYYQNYDTQARNWRNYGKYGVFTYVYERDWFKGTDRDLNKFDMFFSHGSAYDKIGESGYAHIGTCHSPCNTDANYGYAEPSTIYTFADEWDNYPYVHGIKADARKVTCAEWKDPKDYQYGYMKWFYRHVPHFKGINTFDEGDLHLNNWWYYLFDYYGALDYEARLREQIGK